MSQTTATEPVKAPAKKSHRVAILGTFILVFAIIGIISTIIGATNLTVNIIDNTAQKNQFKQAIFPLVLLDPPVFDSIDQLDSNTVLTAAMWDFIIFADKEKYVLDDLNNMTVPAVDIEVHIVKLFGTEAVIDHQEIAGADLQVPYDIESKTYSIPSSASMASYVPEIEKIVRQGNVFTLTVGYVPSGSVWGSDITGVKYEPDPDKFLSYVMEKTGKDSYIITSVQEIKNETVSSEATSSEVVSSEEATSEVVSTTTSDSSSGVESVSSSPAASSTTSSK